MSPAIRLSEWERLCTKKMKHNKRMLTTNSADASYINDTMNQKIINKHQQPTATTQHWNERQRVILFNELHFQIAHHIKHIKWPIVAYFCLGSLFVGIFMSYCLSVCLFSNRNSHNLCVIYKCNNRHFNWPNLHF